MGIDVEALRQAYDTVTLDWSPGEGGFFSMLAAEYARLVPAEDEGRLRAIYAEADDLTIYSVPSGDYIDRAAVLDILAAALAARLVPAEDEGRKFETFTADDGEVAIRQRCICTPDQYQGSGHGVNCPARPVEDEGRYGWHADGDLCLGPECLNTDENTGEHSTDVHSNEWWEGFAEHGRRAAEDEGRLREAHKAWHPDCSGGCEIMRFVGSLAATPEPRPYQHGSEARMADEGRLRKTEQRLQDEAAIMAWPDQETAERLAEPWTDPKG